ncbi:MAG: P-loop NTPase [Rickettsiaceae bacterium]
MNKSKKHLISNVNNIIVVASGKGGVGKSTFATLLADNLSKEGYNVGLADLDIYGPSIHRMFNVKKAPEIYNKEFIPVISRNVQIMSIGLIVDEYSAIAWRGLMANKMVYQILSKSVWNNLDYLIIDTPPGTGDIHLNILQNYHINSAIFVTTPQQIAKLDVIKAIDLYRKFDIPIAGIISNMSYYCDQSGNKLDIFTGNSAEEISKKFNIPIILNIPITTEISNACDEGKNLSEIISISKASIFDKI